MQGKRPGPILRDGAMATALGFPIEPTPVRLDHVGAPDAGILDLRSKAEECSPAGGASARRRIDLGEESRSQPRSRSTEVRV